MQKITKTLLAIQFVLIAFFCAIPQESYAIKAYPGIVQKSQPDGSKISVILNGDEFFNYYTSADGYLVAQANDGYFYYASCNLGNIVPSSIKVGKGIPFGMSKGIPQNVFKSKRAEGVAELSKFIKQTTQKMRTKSGVTHKKALVILVQYSDRQFVTPNAQETFTQQFNSDSYSYLGATGSVSQYYSDNSMGQFDVKFDVSQIVTLTKPASYYAGTSGTAYAREQTIEACKLANPYVDFSQYSSDGVYIDEVSVYFAGHNMAEGATNAIWPHRSAVAAGTVLDGVTLRDYMCTSELRGANGANMAGIGTFCHEFGHILGLPDLYDTSGSPTPSVGLWNVMSLMDGGGYNNLGRTPPYMGAYERSMIGWLELTEITGSGDFELKDINQNFGYVIKTSNPGEVYVLENRIGTGWDAFMYFSDDTSMSPPQGMMILHIDRSANRVGGYTAAQQWTLNAVNNDPAHQCYDLVEASGKETFTQTLKDMLFPGRLNVTSFNHTTKPSNQSWNGSRLGKDLSNIKKVGDLITFTATLVATDPAKSQVSGSVSDFRGNPVANAKVSLYEMEASPMIQSGTFSHQLFGKSRTKASAVYETLTNSVGNFDILNVEPKTYIIEVTGVTGYKTYSGQKACVAGNVIAKIDLIPTDDNPEAQLMKWHGNYISDGINAGASTLYAAVEFNAADQAKFKSNKIESVSIVSPGVSTKTELKLYSGSTLLVTKSMTATSADEAQLITFDLTSNNLQKNNTSTLRAQFKVTNLTEMAVLFLDYTTPTVTGKGNLISLDNVTWFPLTDANFEGNFLVTIKLANQGIVTPYPALNFEKSTYKVGDNITLGINNLSVTPIKTVYKVNGTEITTGTYKFTAAGTQTIITEITYAVGDVETITRKINVTAN